MLESFMKICPENPNMVKMWQKCRGPYMQDHVRFIVAGGIKLPTNAIQSKWYRLVTVARVTCKDI
jgi:hypothetical protein